MTTDTAAQLDLVRQQRDHAEQEVHRLRTEQPMPSEIAAALVLAANVLNAWQNASTKDQIAVYAALPDLGQALDELSFGRTLDGTTDATSLTAGHP